MKKVYPLLNQNVLFDNKNQTFQDVGVKISPSLEGITSTHEMLNETTISGLKKLISLEFNWLPAEVVEKYNKTREKFRKNVLVEKVYGNCKLNCKGCYVKKDDLFADNDLLHPDVIMNLIEESVNELGTKTLKYLGPSEFFRDKDIFKYLDRFEMMGVTLGVFAKDPMFGDDVEVEALFGEQGIHTSEGLVERLSEYKNLRILFNFRTFDEEKTNDLVRNGYKGKENYSGNYKEVQTKSLQLLYKHFVKKQVAKQKEGRLVIVNTPITHETIDEAYEIFEYFVDRGVPVVSTTSMQSGCGEKLYGGLNEEFTEKFAKYYAKAMEHSVRRGLFSKEYFEENGPSAYAGMSHCMQLCNGAMIRSTGQLMRCPGADHRDWTDEITPKELIENGIVETWQKTKNYAEKSRVNVGCNAKEKVFNSSFNEKVMSYFNSFFK